MKKPITNYGKSVKTRLLNLMNEKGYKYMYLLSRYFNERLLYRVSVSQYKDNFLLKGGSLLYAVDGLETRPTIDIDFMASRISMDREYLETVFREILDIQCDADGVTFDLSSLRSEPITVEKKYPGVPNLSLHAVRPGQCIEACGMELTPFQVIHGRLPILAWRNRSRWAYITDLSHMPPEALPQLRGVNTLIVNALRHEPHGSHQSLPEALQLISEIQPHRAYLIHASHQIGLHADLSAKLPPHVMMAYDGLTIEL